MRTASGPERVFHSQGLYQYRVYDKLYIGRDPVSVTCSLAEAPEKW